MIISTFLISINLLLTTPVQKIYHHGWTDFNKNGKKDIYEDPSRSVQDRVEDLLGQMTLEEKTCQLVTLYGAGRVLNDPQPTESWSGEIWKDGLANIDEMLNGVGNSWKRHSEYIYPFSNHVNALHAVQKWFIENTRLGIPVEFSNEGIHGLNHAKATPLPAPIGLGCTWDRELIRQAGDIAGREAELLGYNSVYAPILDLARDQRWGRCLECYGEDPFLVAQMGTQMAMGIQQHNVSAGLKHYAAYSVPKGGRDSDCRTDPHITPRELHELFLYPFKEVISKAHPMVVMASYNDWNGEPVASSHWFLTELLRDTYGFDGYVVSDSDAVEFVYTKHQTASSPSDGARQVLEAGLNVRTNFTMPETFVEPVRKAIAEGILSMDVVDQRVREVLNVKFRMGLFDNPFMGDAKAADKYAGAEHNEDFMLRTNLESFVLLKNEGGLLPLEHSKVKKVLVTGPLADEDNFMSSRYGPSQLQTTTILKGLQDYLGSEKVVYEQGCDVVDKDWPMTEIIEEPLTDTELSAIDKAVRAASEVDVIIAVLGEDDNRTGESKSRTSLDLPGRQDELLRALCATGKPVVLVLVNGQPLTVNWADRNVPAILETWFPSCIGGKAVAMTLFGESNPSGKLTVTFPKSIGQIEYNFPFKKGSHGLQERGNSPNGSGKTRVLGALYPFGYGLSYTTFEYSDMTVSPSKDDGFDITATISNTGAREGTEVVQLYVHDCVSSVVTYESVLRGFERVTLLPGESAVVSFHLSLKDLSILDKNMQWTAEPGDFEIRLGASSEDIRCVTKCKLD